MNEQNKATEEMKATKQNDKQEEVKTTATEKENASDNASKDLAKELEESKRKTEENWNAYLRARADMENIRRRAEIDVENAHKWANERFAREMLAVVDSLDHGLQVADEVKDTVYHEGMELTRKLCLDIFEKFGIKQIHPKQGDTFDPLRHEAISAQINNDIEPNKVLVVAQSGFSLNDRVLRAARVIVSRRGE